MTAKFTKWCLKARSKYRHARDSSYTIEEKREIKMRAEFRSLEPALFEEMDYARAALLVINTEFFDLKHVNDTLDRLLKISPEDQKLEIGNISNGKRLISLGKFLEHQGVYLNVKSEVQRFKDLCMQINDRLDSVHTHQVGIAGYNNRLLSVLHHALTEIAIALRKYTHE